MVKRFVVWALIGALGVAGSVAAQSQSAQSMLDAARKIEVLDGKPEQAIVQYRAVVERFRKTEPVAAAAALLRIAECYQKIGDVNATRTFEQLVREFGNQPQAAIARTRLEELKGAAVSSTVAAKTIWAATTDGPTPYSLSASGRYLVICDWDDNGNLVLRDLTTGADRRLTSLTSNDFFNSAAISPDDQQIAFAIYIGGTAAFQLRLASLRGAGEPQSRLILNDLKPAYVDPVAFTSDGRGLIAVLQRGHQDPRELGIISTSDGSFAPLKKFDKVVPRAINRVSVSPDGKWVAYDAPVAPSSARDVFVISVDTRQEFIAVQHRADDKLVGWSPDGSSVVFVSDRGGASSVWNQRVERSAIAGNPQLIRSDIGKSEVLGISPTGSVYFATSNAPVVSHDIKSWSMDFASGRLLSEPADVVQEYSTVSHRFPRWSPDGRRLAHMAVPPGSRPTPQTRIVIRASDTSRIEAELPVPLASVNGLFWTPDGFALIVQGQDADGAWQAWRVESRTGLTTLLVGGENFQFSTAVAAVSNDGDIAYFRRRTADKWTLIERNVKTGAERPMFEFSSADSFVLSNDLRTLVRREAVPGSSGPFAEGVLVARDLATGTDRELMRRQFGSIYLSPDGQSIATVSNDEAARTRSILIVPINGGEVRQIMTSPFRIGPDGTAVPAGVAFTAWSPDSRSLLARKVTTAAGIASDDAAAEFWWAPIDGRAPRKVLDVKARNDGQTPGAVSVHPDGRRVLMEMRRSEPAKPAEVWVLERVLTTRK